MLKPIAIAAVLLLTPPGTPSGGFHWKRIITPPVTGALMPACVVLDAETFANAAPALRDLRLFQDGSELPYVIEESYDERALTTGVTTNDDRSIYIASASSTVSMRGSMGIAGQTSTPDEVLHYEVRFNLPPHVPVERIRLEPAPYSPAKIQISAAPEGKDSRLIEQGEGIVDDIRPALPFTIGANLRGAAAVLVKVYTEYPRLDRVVLEMRRRSLCYQPRSAAPLTLYLGGGEGMAAKTYDLAGRFSTAIDRPTATMGPLLPSLEIQQHGRLQDWHRAISLGLLGCSILLAGLTGKAALQQLSQRSSQTHR